LVRPAAAPMAMVRIQPLDQSKLAREAEALIAIAARLLSTLSIPGVLAAGVSIRWTYLALEAFPPGNHRPLRRRNSTR